MIVKELNQEIIDIVNVIQNVIAVKKIYLFGSHAYGDPTDGSDYDFFLVLPNDSSRLLDIIQKARIALININRNTPVDILADYENSFNMRKQYSFFERTIYEKGIVMYEQK